MLIYLLQSRCDSAYRALIMMLMPRLRKGFEKSMTCSRSAVMVRGAMARSASCKHARRTRRFLSAVTDYLS